MDLIRCKCCNKLVSIDAAICDSCGMSLILDTAGYDAAALVNDYLRTSMGNISIEILCYRYTLVNEKYGVPERISKKLCDLSDYSPSKRIYMDEDFDGLPTDRSISVELRFTNGSKYTSVNVDFSPGNMIDPRRIGIEFDDEMKAHLVLGDADNIKMSDEFELIRMN